jgi:hypothetical protein
MAVFPPLFLLRCAACESDRLRPVHAVMLALGVLATVAGVVEALIDFRIHEHTLLDG